METPLRSYKLLQGSHSDNGVAYSKGDIITTTKPLNIIFPDRFDIMDAENDAELNLGDKFTLAKTVRNLFNIVSEKTGYPINNDPLKKKDAYALMERLNGNSSQGNLI